MQTTFLYLLQELIYLIKYDFLRFPLETPKGISEKYLNQRIKILKLKGGGYIAESLDYPNLYASGDSLEELREAYYDTTLTYFDIPRYYAKRREDTFAFNLDDGTEIRAHSSSLNPKFAGA